MEGSFSRGELAEREVGEEEGGRGDRRWREREEEGGGGERRCKEGEDSGEVGRETGGRKTVAGEEEGSW